MKDNATVNQDLASAVESRPAQSLEQAFYHKVQSQKEELEVAARQNCADIFFEFKTCTQSHFMFSTGSRCNKLRKDHEYCVLRQQSLLKGLGYNGRLSKTEKMDIMDRADALFLAEEHRERDQNPTERLSDFGS
ncbi:hypothetical protein DFJ73DRAFT_833497 [Zopfochytrium polystomum]|nr:hypothetical protein DFJ73DRAFT_833497 [Zopfochytrium polystomum]